MSSDTDKIVVHRTFLFCVGLRSLKFFNLINFAFLELTRRLERIIYIFEGCLHQKRAYADEGYGFNEAHQLKWRYCSSDVIQRMTHSFCLQSLTIDILTNISSSLY